MYIRQEYQNLFAFFHSDESPTFLELIFNLSVVEQWHIAIDVTNFNLTVLRARNNQVLISVSHITRTVALSHVEQLLVVGSKIPHIQVNHHRCHINVNIFLLVLDSGKDTVVHNIPFFE